LCKIFLKTAVFRACHSILLINHIEIAFAHPKGALHRLSKALHSFVRSAPAPIRPLDAISYPT